MNIKTLKNHAAALLSLLFLSGAPFQHHGQVVCLEEDGHFVIETGSYGRCGGVEAPVFDCLSEEGHSHIAASESHCGACRDFALHKTEVLRPGSSLVRTASASGFISPAPRSVSPSRLPLIHLSDCRAGSPPPHLALRRTVVLLV